MRIREPTTDYRLQRLRSLRASLSTLDSPCVLEGVMLVAAPPNGQTVKIETPHFADPERPWFTFAESEPICPATEENLTLGTVADAIKARPA